MLPRLCIIAIYRHKRDCGISTGFERKELG